MGRVVSINRSKEFEQTVQTLAGERAFTFEESGKKLFPTIRELLTFSAIVGFNNKLRLPLNKSFGTEDIQGVVYEDTEALEYIWLIAVAVTGNVEILQDGREKKCAQIYEEYANGGLKIISEKLNSVPEEQWPKAIYDLCD
jgi:dnd system-associated protein 4